MMDVLPTPAFSSDGAGRLMWFNPAAERFWATRPALGRPWQSCFARLLNADGTCAAPDALPTSVALAIGRKIRGDEMVFERPDHTRTWFIPEAAPFAGQGEQPSGVVTLLIDVSERHQAEDAQSFLFRELKHRMKNTMATIHAIAAQTFRDAPRAERDLFAARLRALGEVHDLLLREHCDGTTVEELLARALAPFQSGARKRIKLCGPPATLSANDCLLFSMVVHELATNAAKYGALSADGEVEIGWTVAYRKSRLHLCFQWRERGGPPVAPPSRRSFGTALIERAFRRPGGEPCLSFPPEGAHCEIEIAL
jgi:two-component sensor histidine kinase